MDEKTIEWVYDQIRQYGELYWSREIAKNVIQHIKNKLPVEKNKEKLNASKRRN